MRARPNLAGKKPVVKFDPDSPICFHWTVEQTADWIVIAGFPFLKVRNLFKTHTFTAV